jgi:hypothetical protein
MTRIFATAAIAALLGGGLLAGLPAQATDRSQLEAGLGGDPAAERSLTLTQLAAAEFDRSSKQRDQQTIIHPGPTYAHPGTTTAAHIPASLDAQLIAGAGLTPDEARGMTLSQIAARKFDRDNSL